MEVPALAPLLNTVGDAIGMTVTNEAINDLPLNGLDITGMSYLSPLVTEVTGRGVDPLGGTNFVSNFVFDYERIRLLELGDTGGGSTFWQRVAWQTVFPPNTDQGHGLALMLLGWCDSGGLSGVGELPAVANWSADSLRKTAELITPCRAPTAGWGGSKKPSASSRPSKA